METTDPIRLVAHDVIGLESTIKGLQMILDICAQWAENNVLNWNPSKSQVLRVGPGGTNQLIEVELNGEKLVVTDVVE